MPLAAVLTQAEICPEIMAFYGPRVSSAIIMTVTVQLLRDHDKRVHELWECGRGAREWEGGRNWEDLQPEVEAAQRERDRSPSPVFWQREDSPPRRFGHYDRAQDSSPFFWRREGSSPIPSRDYERDLGSDHSYDS